MLIFQILIFSQLPRVRVLMQPVLYFIYHLPPLAASVHRVMGVRGKLGEHKRNVWVAHGEPKYLCHTSWGCLSTTKCIHNSIEEKLKLNCSISFKTFATFIIRVTFILRLSSSLSISWLSSSLINYFLFGTGCACPLETAASYIRF